MLTPSDRSLASPVPACGPGSVCLLPIKPNRRLGGHEHATLVHLAGRLAALLGVPFNGDCEETADSARYVVPDDTLVSPDATLLPRRPVPASKRRRGLWSSNSARHGAATAVRCNRR